MTRRWTIEHQSEWPVYGDTEAEARSEAISCWYGDEEDQLETDLWFGVVTIRRINQGVAR